MTTAHFRRRLLFALTSVFVLLTAALLVPGTATLVRSPFTKCGNSVKDSGEQCDDGDINNYDGCSTGCQILSGWACTGSLSICHRGCGNGTVKTQYGEQCDDQNTDDGDGCSRMCTTEKGWTCAEEPSHCHCATTAAECGLLYCGDGTLNLGEGCDNGLDNGAPDNACNANCTVKDGYVCKGAIGGPSRCTRDINVVLREEGLLTGVD